MSIWLLLIVGVFGVREGYLGQSRWKYGFGFGALLAAALDALWRVVG